MSLAVKAVFQKDRLERSDRVDKKEVRLRKGYYGLIGRQPLKG